MRKSQFIFALMLSTSFATMARADDTSRDNCVAAVGASNCVQIGTSDTYYALSGDEDNKTMTIYGTNADGTAATVPEEAFYGQSYNSGFPKSTLPEGVTSLKTSGNVDIGPSAFEDAKGLTSIDLTGVQTIGENAFRSATNLTSIDLTGVKTIGGAAFYDATGLTGHLDLTGVQTIGHSAFWGATNLTSIDLTGVKTIGGFAFNDATGLTGHLDLTGVQTIGANAFSGATNLTSIDLTGVQSIGTNAFYDMSGLTKLALPEGLTSIGANAFAGTNITTLDLPDSLANIDRNAFSNMNSLQSLTISENFQGNLTNLVDGGAYQKALSRLATEQQMLERAQERGYSEDKIARYQERVEQAQAEVDATKANLLANTDLFKINCRGDVEACKANLLAGLSEKYKIVLGTKFPFDVAQATYAEPDGHGGYAIKTYNGKIVGFKNKRIYTIEEANAVAGKVNSVKIRYR